MMTCYNFTRWLAKALVGSNSHERSSGYRMLCGILADIVVALHTLIVLFNGGSVPVILIGAAMRKPFIRNSWFRNAHVGLILLVVTEEAFRIRCPLTVLESYLRRRAGDTPYAGDFIGAML